LIRVRALGQTNPEIACDASDETWVDMWMWSVLGLIVYCALYILLCMGLYFENNKAEPGLGVLFFLGDKYEVGRPRPLRAASAPVYRCDS
jgi:hypothetical protein